MTPVSELKFNRAGLLPAIAQDRLSGEVRMLGYADRDAIEQTLETGFAHFYSRSRQALWKKGEQSGHVLRVLEVHADCDADAVLYLVDPTGPTCHTGERSCFFRAVSLTAATPAAPILARLEAELARRVVSNAERSYTRSLLDGGAPRIGDKIREEASELSAALRDETDARVAEEAADVLFHVMVGLTHRGLSLRDVERVLADRFGTSGHDEKASRID